MNTSKGSLTVDGVTSRNSRMKNFHTQQDDPFASGEDSVLISDRIKKARAKHHYQSKDFSTRDSIFGDVITDLAREYKEGLKKK